MRISFRLFLAVVFVCFPFLSAQAADPFPRAASAYLVKCGDTTVWSKRADRRLAPASLTKIMTTLLVIENGRLDDVVTVSAAAAAETGSRIRLHAGEQLRVSELLAATLLKSANDAAHALADYVAGDQKKFVVLMNRRAAELGLKNTHFVNASGHDHRQHYSTAEDLARLTEEALKHAAFRDMVGLSSLEIATVGGERSFKLKNTNRLLGVYDGLVGGKTGFTAKAGPCLVAVAERGEEKVLLVLLNSPSRWRLAPAIFDRAFSDLDRERANTQVAGLAGGATL